MKQYNVIKQVTVSAGKIKLTKDQYASREHLLGEESRSGTYTIIKPLFFKVGEVVGLQSVPKMFADSFELVAKAAPTGKDAD